MRFATTLEVRLDYLEGNLDKLKTRFPKQKIIPMIKANAYGHGLFTIANFLTQKCGIDRLGVATLGEALSIFSQNPSFPSEVWVFSENNLNESYLTNHYKTKKIVPVIHQYCDLENFLKGKLHTEIALVLKFNTGMNRIGIPDEDLSRVIDLLRKYQVKKIKHVLTHFAVSFHALKPQDRTHRARERFEKVVELIRASGIEIEETSLTNSGALEQGFVKDETHIRPGLMLYGPWSAPLASHSEPYTNKNISRLTSKVLCANFYKQGTPVGYGVNVMPYDGHIYVLPLGYGDGFLTYYSGAEILVGEKKLKVFGRVNMDMCFLIESIGDSPSLKVNEQVEIWNHDPKVISEMSEQIKTIPYQMMCAISDRVPRIYRLN